VKLRWVAVAASTVLACAGLTACQTNVGTAATVEGHRITESDVNDYLTSKARPVTNNNVATSPRSFVLEILVDNEVLPRVVAKADGHEITAAELAAAKAAALQGTSEAVIEKQAAGLGFRAKLADQVVEQAAYGTLLSAAQGRGVKVDAIIKALKLKVSVNPRYGAWNAAGLSIDSGTTDGVPSVVRFPASASASSGASLTP
jgi:hypothetical protein